ncbi:MAG: hypothetical protein QQN41_08205 [Nitrosopumilus sp.]
MSSLLNKSATKKFVLNRFIEIRSGPPMTRVSQEYLDNLESWLKNKIVGDIESHRSVGVTFKP